MGDYNKVYSRVNHPEDRVTLSWDIGYTNVVMYDGDRMVNRWDRPSVFQRGVSFEDEKLGKVKIKFTDTKPMLLDVKINGKRFKPHKSGKQEVDLSGVIGSFWAMMAFTVVALIYLLYYFRNFYAAFEVQFLLVWLTVVSLIYFVTAFGMSRKLYGFFFIGYSYLAFSMALMVISLLSSPPGVWIIAFLLRTAFFVYFTISIRKVVFAIKNKKLDKPTTDILDEKF